MLTIGWSAARRGASIGGPAPIVSSRSPLIGQEDAPQYRAGELRRQAFHVDGVPQLAVQQRALSPPAELAEPGLLIGALPGQVEAISGEHHAVQPERGEGVVEHQARRLGAVAPPAAVGLADENAEYGRAAAPVDVEQVGVADRAPPRYLVDGEPECVGRGEPPLVSNPAPARRALQ